MKISKEHYAILREVVNVPLNATKRQRWDALWAAIDIGMLSWDVLREYNDEHIDTALRHLERTS